MDPVKKILGICKYPHGKGNCFSCGKKGNSTNGQPIGEVRPRKRRNMSDPYDSEGDESEPILDLKTGKPGARYG